jgi:hypothetical protein
MHPRPSILFLCTFFTPLAAQANAAISQNGQWRIRISFQGSIKWLTGTMQF